MCSAVLALFTVLSTTFLVFAQQQQVTAEEGRRTEPIFRVKRRQQKADHIAPVQNPGNMQLQLATNPQHAAPQQAVPAPEHPLIPALRIAQASLAHIDRDVHDYTCTLVKRERINGQLGPQEYIFTKVRHEPFSVYMYFLGPKEIKGRECMYVANNLNKKKSKLIAHEGRGLITPTVKLNPNGFLAMRGQRYPITEVGIRTLTVRLVEVAQNDLQFGECEVKFYEGTKVNGRVCTCIQVTHPTPRKQFRFHLARVFIDDELQVPIRYEAYQWPTKPGGRPILDEEYTYMNLKINQGLTDADFNEQNADYNFH